jgi:hypothetical protein
MDGIAERQQVLGKIGAVLSGDAGNQSDPLFHEIAFLLSKTFSNRELLALLPTSPRIQKSLINQLLGHIAAGVNPSPPERQASFRN